MRRLSLASIIFYPLTFLTVSIHLRFLKGVRTTYSSPSIQGYFGMQMIGPRLWPGLTEVLSCRNELRRFHGSTQPFRCIVSEASLEAIRGVLTF